MGMRAREISGLAFGRSHTLGLAYFWWQFRQSGDDTAQQKINIKTFIKVQVWQRAAIIPMQRVSLCEAGTPLLYVYDVPDRYRDDREGGFGNPASSRIARLPLLPDGVRLWHTAEFGLGDLFLQRARSYRCRTKDPARADLFFVPAFSSRQHNRPTERLADGGHLSALFTRVRKIRISGRCAAAVHNCSALEARGGADHILVNPRNGAPYERHPYAELDYGDPRLGNATLLDLIEPGEWGWFGNYQAEARYHSVPHPSLVHLEPGVTLPSWRSEHPRSSLIVAAFGLGHGPRPVQALRSRLLKACEAAPDSTCRMLQLGDKSGRNHTAEPIWHAVARMYWNGTYCLQPPGDAVSRKAIVDSLLLGCIPVLFHEGQTRQWPWHWGDWQRNASVFLDMALINKRELDPIAALEAIPSARIAQMRRTLAAHAHTMQWAATDTSELSPVPPATTPPSDAFDIVLQSAWARSKEAETVAAGIRAQQTDGAAWDAAINLLDLEPKVGSWGGPTSGTCSRTWGVPGDCTRGNAGTWTLGPTTGIVSLDDCAERCRACARCAWVSFSMAHGQCDWYHTCNTSKLKYTRHGCSNPRLDLPCAPILISAPRSCLWTVVTLAARPFARGMLSVITPKCRPRKGRSPESIPASVMRHEDQIQSEATSAVPDN